MIVTKFGGSSLADSAQFKKVKNIIQSNPARRVVVVSAPGKRSSDDNKITDLLYTLGSHLKYGVPDDKIWVSIVNRYKEIKETLNLDIDIEAELVKVLDAAAYLAPHVANSTYTVNDAIDAGKNVLFEGAQGALLDIDHGTYPFVTSSNTVSGGACTGSGIPPQAVRHVWGVLKAYTTRVGEGPFPTELFDADGEQLRQIGREFGATTGRPRRCGWFDAVAARYSCMVDGIDLLAITKLDCLDGFDKVAICTGYEINGKVTDRFPASLDDLTAVKPVYEWHDGWKQDISGARCWEDLPVNARKYLERVAELVRSKIAIISVGPRRDQTFSVEK